MGKSFVKAFIATQFAILQATSNADRLRFMTAGVKDGRMYNLKGTDLGEWGGDDVEFITQSDAELSRITKSKINTIITKVNNYFGFDKDNVSEETTVCETEPTQDEKPAEDEGLEVDIDEVIAKCKKAIKKGNVKKAKKLLAFVPEELKAYKKLANKIGDM